MPSNEIGGTILEKKSTGRKKSVKDEIAAGVRPKAKAKGEATTKKSTNITSKPAPKKDDVLPKDNVKALPKDKQLVYITANQVSDVKTIQVDVSKIKATSKTIYVADIHALNPDILATVYWIVMPNTPHVVLRITEEQYNDLLVMKEARKMKHLVTVVDNAVFPSLSYGSWSINEINDFPTEKQIREFDAKFKSMKLNFHNQPVVGEVVATNMDEEDFEIDFSEDDADDNDEDEEFDFSEEED